MANSSAPTSGGSGVPADTRTTGDGDHRQVMVPAGETDAEVAKFVNAPPAVADYGLVVRTLAVSTVLYDGPVTGITTTAAAMPTQACREVVIRALKANTANVLIGNATSQSTELGPGEAIVLTPTNLNLVYRKSASGTQALSYLAGN